MRVFEATAGWLSDVAHDPVAFVQGAFPWGEGELANFDGPMEWQQWVLEQPRWPAHARQGNSNRRSVGPRHRQDRAGVLDRAVGDDDSRGYARDRHGINRLDAHDAVARRASKMVPANRGQTFFELTATALISRDVAHEQIWRIDLQPWNANRPESFAGLHNADRRILSIFDEASAIDRVIWQTVMPITTDRGAEVIWCVFGNPLHPEGQFKDCFDDKHWITRHVDSRTVPITNKQEGH